MDGEMQTTANAGTNTNPFNPVNLINTETKKKPYDIRIKNYNPNEPKIEVNMKYSDKQRYRRYKTKTEPKLFSKIMIDEEDDIVNTIKKAFGIEPEKKRNFTTIETSGTPFYEKPDPEDGEDPNIVEMRAPEPEQEPPAPPPARAPQERRPAPAPAPAPKQKPSNIEVEPKTSKEITADLAAPAALSPARIKALFSPTKETAKERLDTLSDIAKAEQEKAKQEKLKAMQEKDKKLDEEASKPFSSKTREEEFQKHLEDNFRDLDEKTVTYLRKQYITTGYLPSPDTFGRTPEEIEKKLNSVASGFYTAKGFTT